MKRQLLATPDEIRAKFYGLQSFGDLAELFEVQKSKLYYYAFKANPADHYRYFAIPKRNGGMRAIFAPSSPLKILQRKLSEILQAVYYPKAPVHGFVSRRSILTNAQRHVGGKGGKRYVFNADVRDFFPTITLHRVTNLLKAKPYNMRPGLAFAMARIACHAGILPQGAPSSPVVSNMICAKMDTRLRILAQESKCVYTRYADDITFSTTLPTFPSNIAKYDSKTGQVSAGDAFNSAIEENGFRLNPDKIRLQTKYERQQITGLIVNKFPNVPRRFVRQIRAMLNAWEKYGYELAQAEFDAKYYHGPVNQSVSFQKVLRGKLEYLKMIRGDDNPAYCKFSEKLAQLDSTYIPRVRPANIQNPLPLFILTEGPSDWKHLKAALQALRAREEFADLNIEFVTRDDRLMGDGNLYNYLQFSRAAWSPSRTETCIFDRDDPARVRRVAEGNSYKKWNARMYSFALLVPSHRMEIPDVCIELYYRDADIRRMDSSGRRLFLSNEFNETTGRHKADRLLRCNDIPKIRGRLTVVDHSVFDENDNSVALSKNDFAANILNQEVNFTGIDFSEFRSVFEMIRRIARDSERIVQEARDHI